MAHRPPAYPKIQGIIWRRRTLGTAFGGAYAEWAYVTPRYPDGLLESDFQREPAELQVETAEIWFLANYQPAFPQFSKATNSRPMNSNPRGGYISSEIRVPADILRVEFGSATDIALNVLAGRLSLISAFWEPKTDRPTLLPLGGSSSSIDLASLREEMLDRFDRLERVLGIIGSGHGGLGHNQGPPLLAERDLVEAHALNQEGRSLVTATANDITRTESTVAGFKNLSKKLAEGIAQGIGRKLGGDLYDAGLPIVIEAFHYVQEIIIGFSQWIEHLLPR